LQHSALLVQQGAGSWS